MHTVVLRGQGSMSGVHKPEVYEVGIKYHNSDWMMIKYFNNPREAYRFCNYLNGGDGVAWDGE